MYTKMLKILFDEGSKCKDKTYPTYMRVRYSLHGQGRRQAVLNGAWGGRGVGPQDDGVRGALKRKLTKQN